MPFFEYSQNNSFGQFDYRPDEGIAPFVVVEAEHADYADWRALQIGLYFDGTENGGPDCPCCGDRWVRANNYWSADKGESEPSCYGVPLGGTKTYPATKYSRAQTAEDHHVKGPNPDPGPYDREYDLFVHYLDGRVEGWHNPGGSR